MSAALRTGAGTGGDWGWGYLLGMPFRTRMPRARLETLCDRRLAWLVRHAALTMPFYRELLERNGIDPVSIGGLHDLERLPLLSREMLRGAGDRAWASDLPAQRRIIASTSGSSDEPLTLAYRFEDRLRKHAVGLHCMWLYGWRPWYRGLALGSQALPRDHALERFGISRWAWIDHSRPVREWLEIYERVRPQAFHSYPSALREFCFEVHDRGPLHWRPRVLSVGGELSPEELDPLAVEVFGRPPLVMYGAVEGGRLAFGCGASRALHVRPDAVHIEILRDGRRAAPGETGQVFITSLINTAMPIIRYELGDLAAWVPGACPCGSWWPRLAIHQGRSGDAIPLPGGRRVPVTSLGAIVGKSRSIRQFQFLRRGDSALLLRFEPYGSPGAELEQLREDLEAALPGIQVRLEACGQLPRTRTGKVRRYVDERNRPAAGKDSDHEP
jgi:phenylacetate-CoA ligase